MHSITELASLINERIAALNINGSPRELYNPITYTLEGGGKRLRPVLMLLTCEMYGGKTEEALCPALGIEIFHNFTLLHDDIMDKAPIRRGRETVFKKWDTNVAILSGDTMFAMAYDYVRRTRADLVPEIMRVFCQTSIEVCEGQQFDMNFEVSDNTSIPDYLNMIRLKTAVALAASMQIGAAIAGAEKEEQEKIYRFGELLGMAFQLQDDLLDTYGDQLKFGKKIGGDILARKKTYMYLKALELANAEQKKALNALYMSETDNPEEKIIKAKNFFTSLGVKHHTETLINAYFTQAMMEYDRLLPDDAAKQILKEFAYSILHREM
ncbi:MAG: polyprenyl synthetase family protein [Bacteroidales bacterium]|nr:polyprenyl synthetase family protein [Bacteroidales bacterium]MDD3010950.1 polyprenyl synthetase family protein [Bacteroidales bacterium]MDD3960705.1 polyprenyl synthetase family protein [Bacteroidales bacterium]MDY0286590.1 polyprenyl synthetase family protein [Bacteroidales bacterium]HPE86263.1 polyprenyl synthetase family protein [Bacteroidales bacterium]